MHRLLVAVLCAVCCVSRVVSAAPCAGFTDVDDSSGFCVNVEWMKNRGITLGCTAQLYCPDSPVSRLAMAAFISRLDTLLPLAVYDVHDRPLGPLLSFGSFSDPISVSYRTSSRTVPVDLAVVAAGGYEYTFFNGAVRFEAEGCAGRVFVSAFAPQTALGSISVVVRGPSGERFLYASHRGPVLEPGPTKSVLVNGFCVDAQDNSSVFEAFLLDDLQRFVPPFVVK